MDPSSEQLDKSLMMSEKDRSMAVLDFVYADNSESLTSTCSLLVVPIPMVSIRSTRKVTH
jgi:hypothetical protein